MPLYNNRQLVVICIFLSLWFGFRGFSFLVRSDIKPAVVEKLPCVYEVRGDVRHPGFYSFNREQSGTALLNACGGTKEHEVFGDGLSLNVKNAGKITFGDKIQIGEMVAQARINFFLPLSVNTSSADDLMLIPGLGIQTAKAIIAYRETHNGIQTIQELASASVIAEKKLVSLMPYLTE